MEFLNLCRKTNYIFFLLLFFFQSLTLYASIAYPKWVDYRQPDNTFVKIKMMGDEYQHFAMSEDGYTLLFDKNGFLVYAIKDSIGDVIPSAIKAVNIKDRDDKCNVFLKKISPKMVFSVRQQKLRKLKYSSIRTIEKKMKTKKLVGERKILVVLMDFPDKRFTKTQQDFYALMNEKGYDKDGACGSVSDYYEEVSLGQLHLDINVVGPFTAQSYSTVYGAGDDTQTYRLVQEAIQAADPVVDFSQYDSDNDGYVDNVHIIYAGHGEEAGGGRECIWAHASVVNNTKADNKMVSRYSCSPELRSSGGSNMTRIGVICHELGHAFGCMDYYDTNYGTNDLFVGTGNWDVMANGNWNEDGARPPRFNPYVACYDFGWISPIVLSTPSEIVLKKNQAEVYRVNTREDNEYFLLENRQNQGFDQSIPGHGLMIYRVRCDANNVPLNSASNCINAQNPPSMIPVCAGSNYLLPTSSAYTHGDINSGDCPFPGASGKVDFNDEMAPSSRSLSGIYTQQPLSHIEEKDGTIYFDFNGGNGNVSNFSCFERKEHTITLQWKKCSDYPNVLLIGSTTPIELQIEQKNYQVGDLLSDGKTQVLYKGTAETFTHSQLMNNQMYYYRIYTQTDEVDRWSSGVNLMVKTEDGIITRFPYVEKFSSFDWKQEIKSGSTSWKKGLQYTNPSESEDDSSVALWCVAENGFNVHSSLLQTSKFDLTKSKYALLSFDLTLLREQELQVFYRIDENSPWVQFADFTDVISWKKVCIPIPVRSASLQIGFLAIHDMHYSTGFKEGNTYLFIDNVGIETDYPAYVQTNKAENACSHSFYVPISVFEGIGTLQDYGIEYQDGNDIKRISAQGQEGVTLTNLKVATSYSYRAYAQTTLGFIYGKTQYCSTLDWVKGEGSYENPYRVETEEDLEHLANKVNSGEDFSGCYFRLANDIRMTKSIPKIGYVDASNGEFVVNVSFNGVFDGAGHTISNFMLDEGGNRIAGLFGCVGKKGIVKNLIVDVEGLYGINNTTYAPYIAAVVAYNYGVVMGCTAKGQTITIQKSQFKRYIGGVVATNRGQVYTCTNYLSINGKGITAGGVVGVNCGVVKKSANYGNFFGEGGASIGGIVGTSTKEEDRDHPSILVIEDCINLGKIEMHGDGLIYVGGIVGQNMGDVNRCINLGEISGQTMGYDDSYGGIIGENEANINSCSVTYCVNLGKVHTVGRTEIVNDKAYLGGICGQTYSYVFNTCFNLGSVTVDNPSNVTYHAVVGEDTPLNCIVDCYYLSGSCAEPDHQSTAVDLNVIKNLLLQYNIKIDDINLADKTSMDSFVKALQAAPMIDSHRPLYYKTYAVTLPVVNNNVEERYIVEYKEKEGHELFTIEVNGNRGYEWIELMNLKPQTCYTYRFRTNNYISKWRDFATLFSGSGSKTSPFLISSPTHLKALSFLTNADYSSFEDRYFLQTQSLDLGTDSLNPWIPIHNFWGNYNGGGKFITNLYVADCHVYAGLFGSVCNYASPLQNIFIVGENTINAPHAYCAGGLVGDAFSFKEKIYYCSFIGNVTGGYYVGGLVGHLRENLSSCFAITKKLEGKYKGGISGYMDSSTTLSNGYAAILNPIDGVSALVNSLGYPIVDSFYYLKDETGLVSSEIGIGQSDVFMKSSSFVNLLNNYSWMADDTNYPINYGYPLLKADLDAEVLTSKAEVTDNKVLLYGISVPGNETILRRGFAWRLNRPDGSSSYQEALDKSSSSASFRVMLDSLSPATAYSYKAFVDLSSGRLYGEEKFFYCESANAKVCLTENAVELPVLTGRLLQVESSVDKKQLIWSSDNDQVAFVSSEGQVFALTCGETTIRVKIANTTVEDSCSIRVVSTTGIESVSEDVVNIQVTADRGTLTISSLEALTSVQLYNLYGILLHEGKNTKQLSIPNLSKGIYLIQWNTAKGRMVKKVLMNE